MGEAAERLLDADDDRAWIRDLAGIAGAADGRTVASRVDEELAETGFGEPAP